jgi:hypothetical protein
MRRILKYVEMTKDEDNPAVGGIEGTFSTNCHRKELDS